MRGLNWTTILAKAGIPDSPGRTEAADATRQHFAAQRQAEQQDRQAKLQAAAANPPSRKSSRR